MIAMLPGRAFNRCNTLKPIRLVALCRQLQVFLTVTVTIYVTLSLCLQLGPFSPLRKLCTGRAIPQGLKPDVFSIFCGTTKVVP